MRFVTTFEPGGGGGDSASRGKEIWHLAKKNNMKPLVVRESKVTEQQLRDRPYKGVFHV